MMSHTVRQAIYGYPGVELEGICDVAPITPGMLLMLKPTGKWVPHDDNGGFSSQHIAVENLLAGGDVDTVYQVGQKVFLMKGRPGDVFWMLLASGEVAEIGNQTRSIGTGYLKIVAGGARIVGICLEAKTAIDPDRRIKIEIY